MTKDELREQMRTKRRSLTNDFIAVSSSKILKNVFSLDCVRTASTLCTFISAFREPDTLEILKKLWSENYKAIVPISDMKSGTLSLSYIDSMDDLHIGAYGILEPSVIKNADPKAFDVILVPALAFDKNGVRIGFGKGYYDRLLSEVNAVKVGLCYDFQLHESIPSEEHDVAMDYIVTEKEIYKVR